MDPQTRERQKRKIVVAVLLVALLVGCAQWARAAWGIEWNAASLRALVEQAGIWGPIVFVALISLRPVLVIPSQVFLISAGICFGALAGAFYAAIGITIGGVLTYSVTRWVGREVVMERMPPGIRTALEGGGRSATLAVLFFGTAYPIGPILWLCVGAALAGIAVLPFMAALFAGGFVRAMTYAYFGSSLVDAELHEVVLGGLAIGAVALLPLLHPRVRAWVGRLLREE